jgi:hypothetical protein
MMAYAPGGVDSDGSPLPQAPARASPSAAAQPPHPPLAANIPAGQKMDIAAGQKMINEHNIQSLTHVVMMKWMVVLPL